MVQLYIRSESTAVAPPEETAFLHLFARAHIFGHVVSVLLYQREATILNRITIQLQP
jgi:hypothetical protein